MLDGGANVGLDSLRSRLRDVLSILEAVIPFCNAGRAAEVVDRDRVVPPLGEAKRELLVEPIEPADVGQDDDPDAVRLLRRRLEGR